jgi:hypothetical protein
MKLLLLLLLLLNAACYEQPFELLLKAIQHQTLFVIAVNELSKLLPCSSKPQPYIIGFDFF